MEVKKYTEANRMAWNQANERHQTVKQANGKYEKFEQAGYSTFDKIIAEKLISHGIEGKDVAQICCNDGEETISLKNLGANLVVGFDISDQAIESAKKLSHRTGIKCNFVRTDAYEISNEFNNSFNIIYISVGSLMWFPNLIDLFSVVQRLLKQNGVVIIYDVHPFILMLDENNKDSPYEIKYSYFIDQPRVFKDGLDYIGKEKYDAFPTYNFDPTLSQIMEGLIKNGLAIEEFEELEHDISMIFGHLDDRDLHIPKSFILIARKKSE